MLRVAGLACGHPSHATRRQWLTALQPTSPTLHHSRPPQDGDTVVIGDLEFEYDSDRSEAGMYDKWYRARREAGIVGKGQARWPHVTG